MERGWIFTVSELAIYTIAGYMLWGESGANASESWTTLKVRMAFGSLWLVVKVWQVADVTQHEVHHRMGKNNRFQINPLFVWASSDNYDLGLSLKYRF